MQTNIEQSWYYIRQTDRNYIDGVTTRNCNTYKVPILIVKSKRDRARKINKNNQRQSTRMYKK